MLQTPRYWQIWSLEDKLTHRRPWPMVEAEVKMQTTALGQFVDDLERRIQRLSQAPSHITILNTNVLLHCQPVRRSGGQT